MDGRQSYRPGRSLAQAKSLPRASSFSEAAQKPPTFLPSYCTTAKLPSLAPHLIHPPCRVGRSIREGKSGEEVSVFILAESNAERASGRAFIRPPRHISQHALARGTTGEAVRARPRLLGTQNEELQIAFRLMN